MHVALFHPAKLPVRRYGGVDRVVVWLARGLAERGHRVTLLATAGSDVPEATLVPVHPGRARKPDFDLAAVLPDDVDVVHAHRPIAAPRGDLPWIWTHHGNTHADKLADLPPRMVCLSANHAARHHSNAFVYNGLDPSEYGFSATKGAFDLFLGQLHTSRGYAWALEGAKRTGHALVVAGGWRPSFRRDLRYVGEVDNTEKKRLLAEAACLWMPAQWDEPFGLPLIEAMASGTPILGTSRGALPEIVSPDTGALGETLEDLVALRERITTIDPEACRQRVLAHFSHRQMAEGYERVYEAVLAGRELPAGRVVGI